MGADKIVSREMSGLLKAPRPSGGDGDGEDPYCRAFETAGAGAGASGGGGGKLGNSHSCYPHYTVDELSKGGPTGSSVCGAKHLLHAVNVFLYYCQVSLVSITQC